MVFLLHVVRAGAYGYERDELYFMWCAQHLAWGYVDQPPLAPFVTWLTGPWGYPVWGLRFLPGVLAGVTAGWALLDPGHPLRGRFVVVDVALRRGHRPLGEREGWTNLLPEFALGLYVRA